MTYFWRGCDYEWYEKSDDDGQRRHETAEWALVGAHVIAAHMVNTETATRRITIQLYIQYVHVAVIYIELSAIYVSWRHEQHINFTVEKQKHSETKEHCLPVAYPCNHINTVGENKAGAAEVFGKQ